jgi:hypothetical protein
MHREYFFSFFVVIRTRFEEVKFQVCYRYIYVVEIY